VRVDILALVPLAKQQQTGQSIFVLREAGTTVTLPLLVLMTIGTIYSISHSNEQAKIRLALTPWATRQLIW
jgi:hypothetical protein